MIELTVKTLDSQNHSFTVEDDITVSQFKEKIADTVNIPADTQRIIYCGRVLQDNSKLNEYDVNGKVVHLVQRPPPSPNQRPNQGRGSPPPHPQQFRRFRGLEYLGSMRFPASGFDPNNIIPPLPTHSLAASRLNVARRMLRRAEAVLSALENPTARPAEPPSQEEQQEDVTPVFEARVIVPNIAPNEPIDEAVVLSAVHDSFLNVNPLARSASRTAAPVSTSGEPETAANSNVEQDATMVGSASSTPETISPIATSSENLATVGADQENVEMTEESTTASGLQSESTSNPPNPPSSTSGTNGTGTSASAENISHTAEHADLLDQLNRFQIRFAPFLERYNNFMREDPVVAPENTRPTQAMINRVSEIMHFLGHAYHSLSDIIVRVRTTPPRPLLCRPILIQHSAIVQAGIPIQVEAQINISANRNTTSSSTTASTATTQPQSTTTTATNNGQPNVTSTTVSSGTVPTITAHMQPTVVGFPILPGAGVRVETFHLPQGSVNFERADPGRNNNRDDPLMALRTADIIAQAAASAAAAAVAASTSNTATTNPSTATNTTTGDSMEPNNIASALASSLSSAINGAANAGNNNSGNNPNLEFFMEVTPESITIDSLETAFVGGSQPHDGGPQVALHQPPPELIQSIMQMAGQLINRSSTTTTTTTTATSSSSTDTSTSETQTTSSNGGAARTTPFQNSQARGNTQTQPTTATHTRSTARPHVHLAQHAMQGFDPFLPCNSHHVTPRRRGHLQHQQPAAGASAQQNGNQNQQPNQANNGMNRPDPEGVNEPRNLDQNNPFYNIVRSVVNSVRAAYLNQHGATQPGAPAANATSGVGSNANGSATQVPSPPWMSNLQNMNLSDLRTPTIAQLLQHIPDDSYTEGESIFTDLLMLLSRNFTIGDVLQMQSGGMEPLIRMRTPLRDFFLYRILDGTNSRTAINRGVQNLIAELQPIIDHLALLDTRDDIDIVRSVQLLLRIYLPNIISLGVCPRLHSLKLMLVQLRLIVKYLCGLILRASRNGQQDVENVFDVIVTRYMQGIPRELQQWTIMNSRTQLGAFLSTLDIPEGVLQHFIVKTHDPDASTTVDRQEEDLEAMQVDEVVEENGVREMPSISVTEDSEPLPEVVLGSEPWHSQVPADWVPIIARDTQRQRRQNSQPPFSDAYLSGMPSKRRKIVTDSKPQGSLPQVITDSVRRAVTTTGLNSAAPVDTVAQAAGADLNIQSAYRDLLRSSVQSELRDNADFTPERFPNANNYFNHPH